MEYIATFFIDKSKEEKMDAIINELRRDYVLDVEKKERAFGENNKYFHIDYQVKTTNINSIRVLGMYQYRDKICDDK